MAVCVRCQRHAAVSASDRARGAPEIHQSETMLFNVAGIQLTVQIMLYTRIWGSALYLIINPLQCTNPISNDHLTDTILS